MDICKQLFHKSRSPQLFNRIVFLRTPQNAAQHPQPAVNHYRHIAGMFFFGNRQQPLLMENVLVISRKFEYMRYIPAMLYITRVRDKDCVKNRVKRAKIVRFTLC